MATNARLFQPLEIRGVTFRNRILVSPMCMYSAEDGLPNDFHLVHLGSRAIGGAGGVIAEASAVVPEGRITPNDLGIWSDEQVEAFRPITRFIAEHGSVPGIQLAHAGRKASTYRSWSGRGQVPDDEGGWQTVAPSPVPFSEGERPPHELSREEIAALVAAFAAAAERSHAAGFRLVEVHAAHGYLLHEFLSPLSNRRTDEYGGSFENRTRIVREVVQAVRGAWPEELPLFIRFSCTDWLPGGWDLEQTIELSRVVRELGVDLVDCSSGGLALGASVPVGPGYQTAFAQRVRVEAGVLTGAVGMIESAEQAEHILVSGQADAVLLARAFLRDPYWPLQAARELGADVEWPVQYVRAKR